MYPLRHRDLKGVDLSYASHESHAKRIPGDPPPRRTCLLVKLQTRFGEKLREIRERAGVSQERLAELAGVHRTYISTVERGKRNISLVNIFRIAEALDVEMQELMPTRAEVRRKG